MPEPSEPSQCEPPQVSQGESAVGEPPEPSQCEPPQVSQGESAVVQGLGNADPHVGIDQGAALASEAEPVSEAAAEPEMQDRASEAETHASRRTAGPRGPNVHTSPSTLSDISPPGCSITMNCGLAAFHH